ncbi:DeoR family transcriptional regulator [Rhodospirillum rubrum]|uniref:DeoR family transcriptional regulator n=1 Tax=Rhodospirillum rubrum TaxID=1085 RepID=UPI001F5B7425|nr:DeoR family transcriptional regulator [Rhodospirillum rubrum]
MSYRRVERLAMLATALEAGGSLRLKEAAKMLGVSEMTVRRDIATGDGSLTYLGGYIVAGQETPGGMGYLFATELASHTEKKRDACTLAASLIEPGDTVFLDCGTTMPHLASRIPTDLRLTVVCYAINVAEILCKKPNLKVVLLGGIYHPSSATFSSEEALGTLANIGINKAFISAGGLHAERGVSCSNFHEVPIKRAAMQNAVRRIVVLDSTKFGRVKPAFIGQIDDFDTVISDAAVPAPWRETLPSGVRLLMPAL